MTNKLLDVSVVIPFRDKAKMTSLAVKTLIAYNPPIREILLVSNGSKKSEIDILRNFARTHTNVKILEYNIPFNYQKINNWAARKGSSKYILFLNNDTEFNSASSGLLERMISKASEPSVGMVGCLLLYGDGRTIQHAGVFLKPGLQGDHIYVGKPYIDAIRKAGSDEYPYDIRESRPLTAVTGAVQLVERIKFEKVNGFDERFIICGGDVDLCIRLNKAGYQSWYVAGGYIIHKESQSRAFKPIPYVDFYLSYISYIEGFDVKKGDPFVPKITQGMR